MKNRLGIAIDNSWTGKLIYSKKEKAKQWEGKYESKVKRHKVYKKQIQNTRSDSQMENSEALTFFFLWCEIWKVPEEHIYI